MTALRSEGVRQAELARAKRLGLGVIRTGPKAAAMEGEGQSGAGSASSESPSSSAVALEIAALRADLAHLEFVVDMLIETVGQLALRKEPTSAA